MKRGVLGLALVTCLVLGSCAARHQKGSGNRHEEMSPSTTSSTGEATSTERAVNTNEAEAAVVHFVCAGQRLLDTPPSQLAEVVRSMWSARAGDQAVTDTVGQLAELRDHLSAGRGPTTYRQSVIAVRVESASASRVKVSAWWVGVLSRDGAVGPQAQWTSSVVTVVREQGQWRVDDQRSEPGPVPDVGTDSEAISSTDLERQLAGFVDWESTR